MDQASPDSFQDLSIRTTAHAKLRVAHAHAELSGVAAPPAIARLYVNDVR